MKPTYFMVPGMFSPFINTFLGTYFVDQIEYLEKRKLPYRVLPLDTEDVIENNAKIIRDHALKEEKIVAFCHSKGGTDLLHCLVLYPEVRERFQKVIFMQSPFYGTPMADVVLSNGVSKLVTKALFSLFLQGNSASIAELTTAYRTQYMQEHHDEIQKIIGLMDIECIVSTKKKEPGKFDSILKLPRDFMDIKFNMPNDGMVPMAKAILPGVKLKVFQDLDHASAVIRMTPQHFDRQSFSHDLFSGAIA